MLLVTVHAIIGENVQIHGKGMIICKKSQEQ